MPTISGLPAGNSVAGANLFACVQDGVTNKVSASQILTYVGQTGGIVAKNNMVAFLGDSITAAGTAQDTADAIRNSNRCHSFWLPSLTHERVKTTQALNFGVSGQTSTQILARISEVTSSDAGLCVVLAGTNDLGAGTPDVTISNLYQMYEILANAGILAIAIPILPRTILTGSGLGELWYINQAIKKAPSLMRGVYVCDAGFIFGDPTSAVGSPRAGYTYDGLHPVALGSYWLSQPLVDCIEPLFPTPEPILAGVSDSYSGSNNPTGNLLSNGLMEGTGGTVSGTGVSGDVADDWTLTVAAGGGTISSLTCVGAKVTGADGHVSQEITLGGTYTGGFATLAVLKQDFVSFGAFQPGDSLIAECNYEVDAGSDYVSGVSLLCAATMSGVLKQVEDGYPVVSDLIPDVAFTGGLRTPALDITATPSTLGVQARIYLQNTGPNVPAITVRFGPIVLRKQ